MKNRDAKEEEMFTKCDARDKTEDERVAEIIKASVEAGYFSRLMEWNEPKPLIFVALIGSLLTGASQPFFAIALSKVLTYLSVPLEAFQYLVGPDSDEDLESMMKHYCAIMGLLAVATFVTMFVQKYCFMILGGKVTYHMRHNLYNTILSKNIGWFDLRENSVGVLGSAMA